MAYELADYYGGAASTPYGICKTAEFRMLPPAQQKGRGVYGRFRPIGCDDRKKAPRVAGQPRPAPVRRLGPRAVCNISGQRLTLKALKTLAFMNGVRGRSKMNKAQLCAELTRLGVQI
jgi:hypothetical protein